MKKNKKLNLLYLIIWNILIFSVIIFVFTTLLIKKEAGNNLSIEENIFLIMIPIFLIVNIAIVIKKIIKHYQPYKIIQKDEYSNGAFIERKYKFLKMYQKLSFQRIFAILFFPFIAFLVLMFMLPLISNGVISLEESINRIFSFFYIEHFIFLIVLSLFLCMKIYTSQERNVNTLFHIYNNATNQEIEALNSIDKKQCKYIFTKDFLINWDGSLNIIPLKEIKKLKYVKYFYLILDGTKLKITCRKKYTIWSYGPSKNEFIKRGLLPQNEKSDKDVYVHMNVNIPT